MKNISVRGAREHNLRDIDVDIPRDRLVVITGVSGSGKSSLAFDTIYAEGQRRYVESLSAYARQFLGQMEKPDVDHIEGLSPAISIEQRTAGRNPRSTVATATEIYDYLRLLFARVGKQHCTNCGKPITRQTVPEMVDTILETAAGRRTQLLAPIVRGRKGEYRADLEEMRREGFLRGRIDGDFVDLEDPPVLDKKRKHTIEIVVDRVKPDAGARQRITDSVETALRLSRGLVTVVAEGIDEITLNEHASCAACGISYEDLEPRMFSFNSPYGACPACDGLGMTLTFSEDRVVPDPDLSLNEGALAPHGPNVMESKWQGAQFRALVKAFDIDPDRPWRKLTARQRRLILHGANKQIDVDYKDAKFHVKYKKSWKGVIPSLERRYRETGSEKVREHLAKFMGMSACPECEGARLKPASLAVQVYGNNIREVTTLAVKDALAWFEALEPTARERRIAEPIFREIEQRLRFMVDVGLDYLTLDRAASTLSGGEAQRIRLATQIGSRLMGVLYVLDEPSIGLHHRDNLRLLHTLQSLRDLGNTVLVVEHDIDTMRSADHIVDLGPGAGKRGGEVVVAGTPAEVEKHPTSWTGRYLAGTEGIPVPETRRPGTGKELVVQGAAGNNLREIDVAIPLGTFTCVTGVSGSGKSTLVNDILHRALARHFHGATEPPARHKRIQGVEHLDKVVNIDQSPIGRTPRSNPATYTGLFTDVRKLFAELPESKVRGYAPGRFSFNVKGGRCEACTGDGVVKIEMHFLPDVYVRCDVCHGRRFTRETLEITFKGRNINDVLEMTVDEAADFFDSIPAVKRRLEVLQGVGLGYIHLGQPATTLSGGEAQRMKLSSELARVATGRTLYILDEPTTGLHIHDVKQLVSVLDRLVSRGNTVVVIEHDLDVIKTADHVIDLGPEGGDGGGRLIAAGTPEEVARVDGSYTGRALRPLFDPPRSARATRTSRGRGRRAIGGRTA